MRSLMQIVNRKTKKRSFVRQYNYVSGFAYVESALEQLKLECVLKCSLAVCKAKFFNKSDQRLIDARSSAYESTIEKWLFRWFLRLQPRSNTLLIEHTGCNLAICVSDMGQAIA